MLDDRELGETQILAALLGVSEMIGNLSDLEEIVGTIVRIAPQLVSVNRCAIFLYDPQRREFRGFQAFSPDPREAEDLARLVIPEEKVPKLVRKIVSQRLPALIKDATRDDFLPSDLVEAFGIRTMLIMPLACRQRVLGMILLDDTKLRHYFTSKEINVVLGIANQTALAMENWQLQRELDRERRRRETAALVLADGMLILATDGTILHVNREAEETFGYAATELVDRRCSDVLGVSDADGRPLKEQSITATSLLWGEPLGEALRLTFFRKDETPLTLLVRGAPIRDERGQVMEVVYSLHRAG
jgi:PAS domain S-box-containing protein